MDLEAQGQYYGIRNLKTHEDSKVAFDVQQVLRNRIAWAKNPTGNLGNVHFDTPIQYSEQPLPSCKVLQEAKGVELNTQLDMRNMTESELGKYNRSLERIFKPTGIQIKGDEK